MDPPNIEHRRWRHKKLGYEVKVLGVFNYGNQPPYRRTVLVDRTQFTKKEKTWAATRFTVEFEPLGRRSPKFKSLWNHLK